MKKKCLIGGKRTTYEVIPGVIACPPHGRSRRSDKTAARIVPTASRKAFERAGFHFRSTTARTPTSSVGRVCIDRKQDHIGVVCPRMTVKLCPSLSKTKVRAALHRHRLQVLQALNFSKNLYDVRIRAKVDPFDLAAQLEHEDDFVYAEPEVLECCEQRFKPSDKFYEKQWQWQTLSAESAWDVTRGKSVRIDGVRRAFRAMRVAVIDWGFDLENPDLRPAIKHVGIFQEAGWNLPATFLADETAMPDDQHGTFCAQSCVARAESDFPCCGIANQADLIPVACLTGGIGTQQSLARAIAFAADPSTEDPVNFRRSQGADVISCSVFPPRADRLSSVLEEALEFATTQGRQGLGCPIFYAVANSNTAISRDATASSDLTIAVGRTNKSDRQTSCARGPGLDFLAPGRNVVVARSMRATKSISGTSYAAPQAAGIAALVLSRHRDLNWRQLREHLRTTADKVGGVNYDETGFHKRYGFGRLNAERAVTAPPAVP